MGAATHSPRALRPIVIKAVVTAILAQLVLGYLDHMRPPVNFAVALATGGIVLWGAFAFDLLARGSPHPKVKDSAELRPVQFAGQATLGEHDRLLQHQGHRLDRAEAYLRLVAAEPELAKAERDLNRAVARTETWETLAEDLPGWNAAVARWSRVVADLHPDFTLDHGPATEAETRAARALMPAGCNFSSQELRAGLTYLVQRERVLALHNRVETYRNRLAQGLAAQLQPGTPSVLAPDELVGQREVPD